MLATISFPCQAGVRQKHCNFEAALALEGDLAPPCLMPRLRTLSERHRLLSVGKSIWKKTCTRQWYCAKQ